MNQELVNKVSQYVTEALTTKLDENYLYHNIRHTERVVKSTKELAENCEINDKESLILVTAAWFHDIGYIDGFDDHEEKSCKIAEKYLKNEGCDQAFIAAVNACIMATKSGHEPNNILEKIIADADCSHFAKDSYIETTELLRQELILLDRTNYSIDEWRDENIKMLTTKHKYYTPYAKENWQDQKDENVKRLIKADKKAKQKRKKEALKVKLKNESPERGVQTMYRIALKNHMELSAIADTKANILLSVNAIIISLSLSSIFPKLDNPYNKYLVIPTAIFILFSVISMALSVLATRPNITEGKFSKDDVDDRKVNLIFFGNFHKMKLSEYEWAVNELVQDKEYLYTTLTRDLYYLGLVLNRKYKILRLTYTIFMIGIVISVIAFGVSYNLYGSGRELADLQQLAK